MTTVDGAKWAVYYAGERENHIIIYRPHDIGDTSKVEGIYKLLACLWAIGQWVDGEFKDGSGRTYAKSRGARESTHG